MSIQNFIDNFAGGTRKNRFRVRMTDGPSYVTTNIDDFHIESAALQQIQLIIRVEEFYILEIESIAEMGLMFGPCVY